MADDVTTLVQMVQRFAGRTDDRPAFEFSFDGETLQRRLTYRELDAKARALAAALQGQGASGQRVLILCQSNDEFLVGLFGCLYAGAVAVPAHPPTHWRTLTRLEAVLVDADAAFALCDADSIVQVKAEIDRLSSSRGLRWLVPSDPPVGAMWSPPDIGPRTPAIIQYTSGSTSTPKGVVLEHRNVLCNLEAIRLAWDGSSDDFGVFWLPLQHDMGLIGAVLETLYLGATSVLLTPSAFIERPLRWLEWISRKRATISVAPNFAYELCVERSTPAERAALDLSTWTTAMCGAEPIRISTLDRFAEAFAPAGFRRASLHPVYGLAEATLLVSGGSGADRPVVCYADGVALGEGRVVATAASSATAVPFVGCGHAMYDTEIVIAHSETGRECAPDEIGDIWVSGGTVARGYWRKPAKTEETFGAYLGGNRRGPYLRTGDLGFVRDGELFVAGRLDDLIVIRGRNYYPDDIEATVQDCHPALLPSRGAAFAATPASSTGQELVVVQEVARRRLQDTDPAEVIGAIRTTVVEHYGVEVHAVVLVKAFKLPTTSSGKIERHTCRRLFLDGKLQAVEEWYAPRPAQPAAAAQPVQVMGGARRTATEIEAWLVAHLSAEVGVPTAEVDPSRPFAYYGVDSVRAVRLAAALEAWLGRKLSPTVAYEYPSVGLLAEHLAEDGTAADPDAPEPVGINEPIAVIGIGCRFPGAGGPDAFWRLLRDGVDAVAEVPRGRWDAAAHYHVDAAVPGRATTRWGGFLDRVDEFDAEFFGISPREAARMDPQQRLLLEVAWEALEDAGQVPERLAGSRTGVYVGISTNDYAQFQLGRAELADSYAGTGNALSIAANRLSYVLDLRGPSISVDTACSSSLVAVHLACRSLLTGESTLALAGGVNVILSPTIAISFSKAGVMAADGRCKTFDARADGYVRGEGAGVVVLKPLARALADGDPVYATIRGSAVNQDGRTNGLMAPSRQSQEAVLAEAYRRSGLPPAGVGYVEAHGTGTFLGDPIEAAALSTVLSAGRPPGRPCLVGSVKTNIGHLEAAAGVAGLIKVALALKHREVPPSLHFEEPSPHIAFDDLGLRVPQAPVPWPDGDGLAVAGVSSFGFGGTNAHVVLSEAPLPSAAARDGEARAELLPLSARSADALRELAAGYEPALARAASLANLCHTAGARRAHHDHRLAVVGHSTGEVAALLAAWRRGESRAGTSAARCRPGRRPAVVFVFSGQGSQWVGMGSRLQAEEPVFRDALAACDAALREHVDWSLLDQLAAVEERPRLSDIDVVQPAVFAVQVALAALWRSWGVEPNAVVGHSMGEVAAAHVAGALTLADAARVICTRASLLKRLAGQGGMVSAEVSMAEAQQLVTGHADRVDIAASNGSRSTVLSGDPAALAELVAVLRARDVFCRWVRVDVAAHSPQVEALRPDLVAALGGLQPVPAAVPIWSTVTGDVHDGELLGPAYWADNVRQPVRFAAVVRRLLETGHDTFVEVSPHPLLLGAIRQDADELMPDALLLPSLRRDTTERDVLLASLGRLYTAGQPVRWASLSSPGARHTAAPTYPWQRTRAWIDDASPVTQREPAGPLLGQPVRSSVHADTSFWELDVGTGRLPLLAEHRVHGTALLPAALYLHAVAAAAGRPCVLSDVVLHRPLALADEEERTLQLVLVGAVPGPARFECYARESGTTGEQAAWTLLASGVVTRTASDPVEQASEAPDAVRGRCREHVPGAAYYRALAGHGVEHGPAFQAVDQVWRRDREALGRLAPPPADAVAAPELAVDLPLLDACFQVLAATVPPGDTGPDVYLPAGLAELRLSGELAAGRWCHAQLRAQADAEPDTVEGDVLLLDDDGRPVLAATRLRLRRLPGGPAAAGVAESYYALRWAPAPQPPAGPLAGGQWLIIAASERGPAVQAELARQGEPCVLAMAGPAYAQLAADRYTVDLAQPEQVRRLFDDTGGPGRSPYRSVVHLSDGATDQPELAVRTTVGAVHVAQALARAEWPAPPRLWLVTVGAQAPEAAPAPVSVGQAPLWGLGRSVNHEHPELRCTRVDLSADGGPDDVAALVRELRGDGPDFDVALRGDRRYVARLAPYDVTAAPPAPRGEAPVAKPAFHVEVPAPGRLDDVRVRLDQRHPPGPGEVEIEVHAAGLNFIDTMQATGVYPGQPDGPVSLGVECAGTVVAIGDGVGDVRVGDEVVAVAPRSVGAFVTTRACLVAPKPPRLNFAAAAALPVAFLTAYYALHEQGRLRRGERVLVHSAAGGVGLAAVQVARWLGAEVYATAGSAERRAHLRALGIEHIMDSRSLAFADEVLARTGGAGVDVVLNSLPGEAMAQSLVALAPYGRFVEIGKRDVYQHGRVRLWQLRRNASYTVVDLAQLVADRREYAGHLLREVVAQVSAGAWQPLPVELFPLADTAGAVRRLAQPAHVGKVVVSVRDRAPATLRVAGAAGPRADATYLVTGGLGGLGRTVATSFAESGARQLVLLGRSAAGDAAEAALDAMRACGADVVVRGCDITRPDELADVLRSVRQSMPPLRGVVHAAGVLDDRILASLDEQCVRTVMAPKVAGAWNLHVQTRDDPLDFFVLFSSAASLLGSPAQAHYAAANAFLDALAWQRRAAGQPALSVNWGPWADVGLATAAEQRRHLARYGVHPIAPDAGMRALAELTSHDVTQVAVLRAAWPRHAPGAASPAGLPLLAGLLADVLVPPPGGPRDGVPVLSLRGLDREERRQRLESYLRDEAASRLGMDPTQLDVQEPLNTLGLDSLMASELRSRIHRDLGVVVPVVRLLEGPSVAGLAAWVSDQLEAATAARADGASPASTGDHRPTVVPAAAGQPAIDLLTRVSELSDDAVDDLLRMIVGATGSGDG